MQVKHMQLMCRSGILEIDDTRASKTDGEIRSLCIVMSLRSLV